MKLIIEKKISGAAAGFILYLSFCFAGFYMARGEWGYNSSGFLNLSGFSFMSSAYVAFFAGGLMPFLVYELITSFSFKMMRPRLGFAAIDLKYSLRFFYIAANLVIALFTLLYLISPVLSVYGTILIPFIITSVFFVLYIKFIFRYYIEKYRRGITLMQLGGIYAIFYTATTLVSLMGAVVL